MIHSTEATLCPYCNAVLPLLSAPANADKLPCPRCGEPVPASRWQVDTAIASGPPKAAPAIAKVDRAANRRTIAIILGIMFTMAIISLSYALWTTKLRRSRDPKLLLDPIVIRGPLELQGLGYLPRDRDRKSVV